ncbi:MAG: ATP-binding protein [Candidatus Dormiibacterota bacterium]
MSGDTAPQDKVPNVYTMRLSLNVLDHLGLNLYSNIPAVLSEVVANSWDADAETVTIVIDAPSGLITITDDGIGMSVADLNERFLFVGFKRRDGGSSVTARGRPVMGRKGIGKLSLFAIADTIQVESFKDGQRAGLVLKTSEIRAQMAQADGEYHPTAIDPDQISLQKGTEITLTDLRLRPTETTRHALRRRLARRFSIIGPEHGFAVSVDGVEISVADRDYYSKIEYLWSLGDVGDVYEQRCLNATKKRQISGIISAAQGWTVTGWVGTVDEQKSIDDETNVIPVLARGKLIHEDLLASVKPAGVFAKYVMGEIHADFVDTDDRPDIATSDRQSLKEDDPRFEALIDYLDKTVLREVGNRWRDWRRDDALDKARTNPVVEEWYLSLGEDQKRYAKQLFGKIGNIALEREADRIELYKHGILAFERLRLRDLLGEVEKLDGSALQFDVIGRAFASIDDIEAAQYGEIARGRISVIGSFVGLVDADAKERVIQRHLFDHLWLLDSSWERASTNERIEETVMKEFAKIDANLTVDEKAARIDIRYRTAAGKHIIIELKRYSVTVSTSDLVAQIGKYRSALQKCIAEQFPDEPHEIECIAVVGKVPTDLSPDEVKRTLAGLGTRVVTYDMLIANALRSYQDYLERHKEVSRLAELIERLEASAVTKEPEAPD